MFESLFNKRDPKTVLEGLDKSMAILNDRYEKKQITVEEFAKKSEELGKQRAKYQKQMEKGNRF